MVSDKFEVLHIKKERMNIWLDCIKQIFYVKYGWTV